MTLPTKRSLTNGPTQLPQGDPDTDYLTAIFKRRPCPGCGKTYAWYRRTCWHGIYGVKLREYPRLERLASWLGGQR